MKVTRLVTSFVILLSTLTGFAESGAGRGVPQSVREEVASALTVQEAKLGGTTTNQYSFFGWSVAASGDTVVVGAPGSTDEQGNSQPGAVYVFVEPAGGWQNMVQTAELTPSDNSALEGFGFSVAIAGDTIVVGGPGRVFIYLKPSSGWQNMTESAVLQDQSTVSPDGFGNNVAIDPSGDTIVVTAPDSNVVAPNGGAAFVFLEPQEGWQTTSSPAAMLTASDDAEDDNWGDSVAIADDGGGTIVIGAPFTPLTVNYGAAYVYMKPKSGWANATETAKLTASKQVANAELGYSVSISGDIIVAGAPGPATASGSAYLFDETARGWKSETESARINLGNRYFNAFGASVALTGKELVVGADFATVRGMLEAGAAYLFLKPATGWASTSKFDYEFSDKYGEQADGLGVSVAINGDTIIAGAPSAYNGDDVGFAFVFTMQF